MFGYFDNLACYHRDSIFDEYIERSISEDTEYIPYGDWFTELPLGEFSDTMLSHWAALREIYVVTDYLETRLAVQDGLNPTFQELLDSLKGEVGDPDQ